MNRHDDFIQRLADATRRASLPDDLEPPIGFATRIVAGLRREPAFPAWERLVWSSVAAAGALCITCLGWEWTAPHPDEDVAFVAQFSNFPFQP